MSYKNHTRDYLKPQGLTVRERVDQIKALSKEALDEPSEDICMVVFCLAADGNLDLLKEIQTKLVLSKAIGKDNLTIVHYAATNNDLKCIKYLLNDLEMDPKKADRFGQNALHHAVLAQGPKIAQYLVENHGLSYTATSTCSETPLDIFFSMDLKTEKGVRYDEMKSVLSQDLLARLLKDSSPQPLAHGTDDHIKNASQTKSHEPESEPPIAASQSAGLVREGPLKLKDDVCDLLIREAKAIIDLQDRQTYLLRAFKEGTKLHEYIHTTRNGWQQGKLVASTNSSQKIVAALAGAVIEHARSLSPRRATDYLQKAIAEDESGKPSGDVSTALHANNGYSVYGTPVAIIEGAIESTKGKITASTASNPSATFARGLQDASNELSQMDRLTGYLDNSAL